MKDIRELLFEVGKKNEVINPSFSKERALKRMEVEEMAFPGVSLQNIRDSLLGLGRILEESSKENYCLSTVCVGPSAAVLIAHALNGKVEIAAYAEEGLICQHLAKNAIESFVNRLESLKNKQIS